MPAVSDDAPNFTAPIANGEVEPFTLSEHLDDAPLVLAFFPGAFTGVCTTEMATWQDRLTDLESAGATIYGVSVDAPFSLNEFREQNDLDIPIVSDTNKEIIDAYDVETDFADMGYYGLAQRAVFVLDSEGTITYAWVADDPGTEPDYDEVIEAAAEAA
jgi:peroxiredoxin